MLSNCIDCTIHDSIVMCRDFNFQFNVKSKSRDVLQHLWLRLSCIVLIVDCLKKLLTSLDITLDKDIPAGSEQQ